MTRSVLWRLPVVLGAAAAAAVGAVALLPHGRAEAEDANDAARSDRRALRRTPIVSAIERSAPSVVSVGTTRVIPVQFFDWASFSQRRTTEELKGLGSGVLVHPSGLVVTNAHVINQADQVVVRLTGLDPATQTELPATIVATDLAHDLALLRIEKPGAYPTATFGRSDDLMCGETVIAIGSPVGLGRTVSTGIVSALDRSLTIKDQTFEGLIQTDAAVNQGNSGGALLNILGEWIGVNSAIASFSGGSDGISFAIPIATVGRFLARSVESGRLTGRWAGLEFGEDASGRVTIATVFPVGPAQRAGLRAGMIVRAVRGAAVATSIEATMRLVDAGTGAIAIDVADKPDTDTRRMEVPLEAPPLQELAWTRIGIHAAEVTPEIREQTQYPVGSGIVVTDVREGSPASRVGLQPGDLLVAMGDRVLRASEELHELLQWTERDTAVPISLFRPVRTPRGISVERWKARITVE